MKPTNTWVSWRLKPSNKGNERQDSKRISHSNDSIAENGQHPEMSPGDLRGLAVTQSPVKNHQLTLM